MTQKLHTANKQLAAPPLADMIFLCVVIPLLSVTLIGDLPVTVAGALITGWCFYLIMQVLYAGLALNNAMAGSTSPGHLAALLEAGCDAQRHRHRLRKFRGGITAANILVITLVCVSGYVTFGPLAGLAGGGLVFAIALHSYTRSIRYSIWSLSALVAGYALHLAITGQGPFLSEMGANMIGAQFVGLCLCALVAVLAYNMTVIDNLRHIAGLGLGHSLVVALFLVSTSSPAVTNLAVLSSLLFAPGFCALFAKTRSHCRHRLYGSGNSQ